jgi:hypothetical protein
MNDSAFEQLKLLIVEPECILAGELADELRMAFDADVVTVANMETHQELPAHVHLAVLDCPPSFPALNALFAKTLNLSNNFIITHTHDLVPNVIPQGLNAIWLVKPYRMEALVEAARHLLDL